MSAAFAASSLVFRESDPAFSEELGTAAATLYTAVGPRLVNIFFATMGQNVLHSILHDSLS